MFQWRDLFRELGLPELPDLPAPASPAGPPTPRAKAARVRRLLADPQVRATWSVKKIARTCGVSWGMADRICRQVRGPLAVVRVERNGQRYQLKTGNLGGLSALDREANEAFAEVRAERARIGRVKLGHN